MCLKLFWSYFSALNVHSNMNHTETCSSFSASTQISCGTPMLHDLHILISYIFLLREPTNVLSDHYVAVLIYRTVLLTPLVISVGVCLLDIIRCVAKIIGNLLVILMKITYAVLELSRSQLILEIRPANQPADTICYKIFLIICQQLPFLQIQAPQIPWLVVMRT